MGKGKKDEKKTIVNTKQPKSGKVEKASAKDKKGPSKKGVEKVAQIVKSKAPSKDVKVVAKSVPPKKKEEPKKQQKYVPIQVLKFCLGHVFFLCFRFSFQTTFCERAPSFFDFDFSLAKWCCFGRPQNSYVLKTISMIF